MGHGRTRLLGPFGDVCQAGRSQSLEPPAAWEVAAAGAFDTQDQDPVIKSTFRGFDQVVPGFVDAEGMTTDKSVIFGWGNSGNTGKLTSAIHRAPGC